MVANASFTLDHQDIEFEDEETQIERYRGYHQRNDIGNNAI